MTASSAPQYPLATTTWDGAEYAALNDVIASGRFTMGARVRAFEEAFANFVGSKHAVMVNSGSSANLLGVFAAVQLEELRLQPGDEVIVPAVSWATTYYPISQAGLIPVLVDVDSESLNIDVDMVREAITDRTRAVMAVNLLGNPVDFASLEEICEEAGLLLFEDNCESLGATFRGKHAGTFGLFGTFSFFFSHHISTMEGGMVVTDSLPLYEAMLSMRAHGWTRDLPTDNTVYSKSGNNFDDLFRFVLPGFNLRPLEMSGALGLTQLEKLPSLLSGRRHNAQVFRELFASAETVKLQRIDDRAESSWFGFSLLLDGSLSGRRAEVVDALSTAGIESRPVVAGNFAKNPVMSRLSARVHGDLSAADRVHSDGLFVGNHHYPINEQLDSLLAVVTDLTTLESGSA